MIASDPRNPAGYAGLADAFAMTADYGFGSLPKMTYLGRARRLAQRALGLDPQSAAAHASLGMIAGYSHDAAGAMRELRRAIALDPGYPPAHHWLGRRAIELDPARGDSFRDLGLAYAAKGGTPTRSQHPGFSRIRAQSVRSSRAGVYARAGQPKLALSIFESERRSLLRFELMRSRR